MQSLLSVDSSITKHIRHHITHIVELAVEVTDLKRLGWVVLFFVEHETEC